MSSAEPENLRTEPDGVMRSSSAEAVEAWHVGCSAQLSEARP